MKHVTHWIGGKPWDGEASRHGDMGRDQFFYGV
jgi:hypothetical protein